MFGKIIKSVVYTAALVPSFVWGVQFGLALKVTKHGAYDEGATAVALATLATAIEFIAIGALLF